MQVGGPRNLSRGGWRLWHGRSSSQAGLAGSCRDDFQRIRCGEDRVGGCWFQYLIISARLLTSAVSSQTMDLSLGLVKEETSLANHCQTQQRGSSSSDGPVPPSHSSQCPSRPGRVAGLPRFRLWAWHLEWG